MKKLLSLLLSVIMLFGSITIVNAAKSVPYGGPDYAAYPNEFSDYQWYAGWDYAMEWLSPENVWDNPWDKPIVIQTLLSADGKNWSENLTVKPGQKFKARIRLAKNEIDYCQIYALEFTPVFRRSLFTADKSTSILLGIAEGYVDKAYSGVSYNTNTYPKDTPKFWILWGENGDTTNGLTFDMCEYELTASAKIPAGEYTITTDLPCSVTYWDEKLQDLNDKDRKNDPTRLIYGVTCATVVVDGGSSGSSEGSGSTSKPSTEQTITTGKKTGWQKINGTWYYYNANGNAVKGWVKDGGAWYYLKSNGAMATGWVKDGSAWYYMNSSGAMQTGWVHTGGKWYYMHSTGSMAFNQWIETNGKWYYVTSDGSIAVNTTIGTYKVDENGVWVD